MKRPCADTQSFMRKAGVVRTRGSHQYCESTRENVGGRLALESLVGGHFAVRRLARGRWWHLTGRAAAWLRTLFRAGTVPLQVGLPLLDRDGNLVGTIVEVGSDYLVVRRYDGTAYRLDQAMIWRVTPAGANAVFRAEELRRHQFPASDDERQVPPDLP